MEFKLLKQEHVADKVFCQICGESCSLIIKHLKESHPERVTSDIETAEAEYNRVFPDAPLYSTQSYKALMAKLGRTETQPEKKPLIKAPPIPKELLASKLNTEKEETPVKSNPQPVTRHESVHAAVPLVDPNYIQPELETALVELAYERNMPAYFFGLPGNGKTSLVEQYCARNNLPMFRVQHSGGLEDYEILGSERINSEGSYYAEGLLPTAMRLGYVYLADEYDFAQPSVLAIYQSVLEGKPVVLRGANNGTNIVKPHPNFRFFALGNTNGAGDDTGLFQGTKLQNAANMERFGIVQHMTGIGEEMEKAIVLKKTNADAALADEVIEYVKLVRKSFEEGRISNTIGGVRVILNIVNNGIDVGDMMFGTKLAFSNRLPARDAQLVDQFAQRIWG